MYSVVFGSVNWTGIDLFSTASWKEGFGEEVAPFPATPPLNLSTRNKVKLLPILYLEMRPVSLRILPSRYKSTSSSAIPSFAWKRDLTSCIVFVSQIWMHTDFPHNNLMKIGNMTSPWDYSLISSAITCLYNESEILKYENPSHNPTLLMTKPQRFICTDPHGFLSHSPCPSHL